MKPPRDPALPARDRFTLHWLAYLAVTAALWAGWRAHSPALAGAPPPPAVAGVGVDWYLVLRMPPITSQHESGVETMKTRYALWLAALRREGFQPLKLSDAWYSLSRGRRLPPRSVVMVFEPGYRRTLQIVDPIFKSYDWPAVWLTDERAMRRGQREFVTYHTAARLSASGWWDVGYSRTDGGYRLESAGRQWLPLGGRGRPWSAIDGTFALDRGARLTGLNILTVNADWTPAELVARLRAEVPAEEPSWLARATIHGKEWGVLAARRLPARVEAPPRFDLEAPLERRSAKIFWLSTRGVDDFRVRVAADSLLGELQLHLRCDETAGSEVEVALDADTISVTQRRGALQRRLYAAHRRHRGAAPDLEVAFVGRRLSLAAAGETPWLSPPLDAPGGRGALLQLSITEKARGLAAARGLRVRFEPARAADALWAAAGS